MSDVVKVTKSKIDALAAAFRAKLGTEEPLTLQDMIADVPELAKPKVPSWADATWEEITSALSAHDAGKINIYDYWKVGDTKTVPLAAMTASYVDESHVAQDVELVLVDKNVVDLSSGGKCHFVWHQKGTLANDTKCEYGYMKSTQSNSGGWRGCARRSWCNNVYYNALPSGFQSIIKEASINSSKGDKLTTFEITQDKIFLPAERNIFGTAATHSVAGEETVQWEYYKTSSNRIKYIGKTETAVSWWLRSPRKSSNADYCFAHANGLPSDSVASNKTTIGLAPCGCI